MTKTEFKSCGTCRACCVVPNIEQLNKPAYTACKHLTAKEDVQQACTNYEYRPSTCSNYQCYYTQSDLPQKYRPDECGVIIEAQENPVLETQVFVFLEVYPGAADKKLMDEAARKLSSKMPVCIRKPNGSMKWVLGVNHRHLRAKLNQKIAETKSEDRVQVILA